MILDLEIFPVWNGSAYRCELCGESGTTFPDISTMRVDHLFAPFLEWCNEKFLTSLWLEMMMLRGSTLARLRSEITDPVGEAISGRVSGLKKLSGQSMCRQHDAHVFYIPTFE